MQPKLLSLEPLLILSWMVLALGVLPLSCFVVIKLGIFKRAAFTATILVGLSAYFLWLGEAVGRSKAWYHWRSEYQQPAQELQIHLKELARAENTNAIMLMCDRLANENVQAYGREELFHSGRFSQFVQAETGLGRTAPKELPP